MSVTLNIPNFVSDKTAAGLRKKMLIVQSEMMAKVNFFAIYFNGKEHFAWYYPPMHSGGTLG